MVWELDAARSVLLRSRTSRPVPMPSPGAAAATAWSLVRSFFLGGGAAESSSSLEESSSICLRFFFLMLFVCAVPAVTVAFGFFCCAAGVLNANFLLHEASVMP